MGFVWNCPFFMGIIFSSSVVLVSPFNTRGVYNFITKRAIILVNLVPLFSGVSFLFCRFLKSRVTNELKSLFLWKSRKVRGLFIQNRTKLCCWQNASLVSMEGRYSCFFFKKKRVIHELGSRFNQIRLNQRNGSVVSTFFFSS